MLMRNLLYFQISASEGRPKTPQQQPVGRNIPSPKVSYLKANSSMTVQAPIQRLVLSLAFINYEMVGTMGDFKVGVNTGV
jgi:hypothetical protein